MKRILAVMVILAIALVGCTPKTPTTPDPVDPGVVSADYNTIYSGEPTTINYLVTATIIEMEPAMNAVSGMMEHDQYGVLLPSAAEDYTTSADGLVYTFKLREGQMWYRHDGEEYAETVAQDFVDAMKYALDPVNSSQNAHIRDYVAGAQAYYTALVDETGDADFSTVGIKALDRYTVEYTLRNPTPWFLSLMTHSIFRPANGDFLAETGDRFGTDHTTFLSNGPYILSGFYPQDYREFVKNENYWDAKNVHIGKLTWQYNREAGTLAPELFWRGEITSTGLSTAVLDGWVEDAARAEFVTPADVNWMWNFWWAFNFNPQFSAEWEPENWRIAVMNENFRKSIYYGLDRIAAQLTVDPFNPERQLKRTMTPPNYVSIQGVDYTELPALAPFSTVDQFQPDLAKQYAELAKEELEGVATFPVKIKWTFNTGTAANGERAQVIEQQLETLFGPEYVDIVPVGYPSTDYLGQTRRNGNYAMQDVNQGSTYLDPYSYTSPFHAGQPSWTDTSLAIGNAYQELLDMAHSEVLDLDKRYTLFSEAEAYLLEHAVGIPWRGGGGGYQATRLQPFTRPYNAVGLSNLSFKYAWVRETAVTADEFVLLQQQWEIDRAAALAAAGQ